jgi:hypothetical protein
MNIRRHGLLAVVFASVLLISILTGCGNSGGDGPSLQDLPRYPNAAEGESMEQSSPGGFISGELTQFTTTDTFDEVLEFYKNELNQHNPEFLSKTSDLGRQTAISIPQKTGMLSVSIQEFTAEGTVNITFMVVGI